MKEHHFFIALLVTIPFVLIILFLIIYKTKKKIYSANVIFENVMPLLLVYICSMLFLYISLNNTDEETALRNTLMEKEYLKIEFEGDISSVNVLNHYGTPQCLICVRITHSNIDSFYRFDKIGDGLALKIKDSIASLPIGGYDANDSLENYSFVQVNIKGSNLIIFSNNQGDTLKLPLSYRTGGLFESDFSRCDANKRY